MVGFLRHPHRAELCAKLPFCNGRRQAVKDREECRFRACTTECLDAAQFQWMEAELEDASQFGMYYVTGSVLRHLPSGYSYEFGQVHDKYSPGATKRVEMPRAGDCAYLGQVV